MLESATSDAFSMASFECLFVMRNTARVLLNVCLTIALEGRIRSMTVAVEGPIDLAQRMILSAFHSAYHEALGMSFSSVRYLFSTQEGKSRWCLIMMSREKIWTM